MFFSFLVLFDICNLGIYIKTLDIHTEVAPMLSKSYSSSVDSLDPAILSGLFGSSASKLFVQKHLESNKCSLIVCKDNSHAEEIISQVKFFSGMSEEEIIFFPELETLPYDSESPNSSLISKRISAVQKLISGDLQGKIIIATSFFSIYIYDAC